MVYLDMKHILTTVSSRQRLLYLFSSFFLYFFFSFFMYIDVHTMIEILFAYLSLKKSALIFVILETRSRVERKRK